ncbi:MAG: site-2 protease family protein [Nocardioidaceae bacterium]
MSTPARPVRRPGAFRIGTLVGVDVYISTSWILIAALLTVSLSEAVERARPGLGSLKFVASFAFVVLFYLSVLLHEMSHAVMAKRFGIQVRSMELSFFGGATEIDGESARPREEFWIAVVGPVTSIAVGLACIPLAMIAPDGLLDLAAAGLAATNIFVGVLNLVPGLPFDGGRVLRAGVWAASGDQHQSTVIAGWAGRVVAVLLGTAPLWLGIVGWQVGGFNMIFLPIMAVFLWQAASMSIASGGVRRRLPALKARELARRVALVPGDTSVAEAVRRTNDLGAGGIVAVDSTGAPSGIVVESALNLVPDERRPWTTVSMLARTLEPGLVIPADLSGEPLIRAMQQLPATEYLLVEPDGRVYGLLATSDVDRAFSAQQ